MSTKLRYKPGSWYRISDFSGFAEREGNTRKTWQGYWVTTSEWEARNSQDWVRGRRDNQIAPEARPRQANQFLGLETTLALAAAIQNNVLYLQNSIDAVAGNTIAIILDDGSNFFTTVVDLTSGDYNSDWNSDFATGFQPNPVPGSFSAGFSIGFPSQVGTQGYTGVAISPAIPFAASAGNLVQNLSAPQVSLADALSSVS
jgi:hypothetical protein